MRTKVLIFFLYLKHATIEVKLVIFDVNMEHEIYICKNNMEYATIEVKHATIEVKHEFNVNMQQST